jgi:hypothetical protein
MKQISTILLIMLFAHSFAQTQVQPTPVKPTPVRVVKKTTTNNKPTTVTNQSQKPQATPAPQQTTPTETTGRPASTPPPATNQQPRPVVVHPAATTNAQQPQSNTQNQAVSNSLSHIESIWIGGSVGGGLAVSTNIIGSGAVFPTNLELLFQTRHHRCGIGFANELYITPEALGHLLLGEAPVVKKLYFSYEAFVFRNFPINIGFSSHVGFFGTNGNHTMSQKSNNSADTATSTARGGMFGNIGLVLEVGARPFYFFVRPSIEYKSWSGFHKEIMATGSIGIRFKFLTQYEIERRADKKHDRYHKW